MAGVVPARLIQWRGRAAALARRRPVLAHLAIFAAAFLFQFITYAHYRPVTIRVVAGDAPGEAAQLLPAPGPNGLPPWEADGAVEIVPSAAPPPPSWPASSPWQPAAIRLAPAAKLLLAAERPIPRGTRIAGGVWVWGGAPMTLKLQVARHGRTAYEGTTQSIAVTPAPKLRTLSHAFQREHAAVRLLLANDSAAPVHILAASPRLVISRPGPALFLQSDSGGGFNRIETVRMRPRQESGEWEASLLPAAVARLRIVDRTGQPVPVEQVTAEIGGRAPRTLTLVPVTPGAADYPAAEITRTRMGHPLRLVAFQLALGGLLLVLGHAAMRLVRRHGELFRSPHFLAALAVVALPRLLWLVGEWPAAMDADALTSWAESRDLDFANYHPYSHALYFLAFRQVWDHPALVSLFQIAAFALLAAFWAAAAARVVERRAGTTAARWAGRAAVWAPVFLFALNVPLLEYSVTLVKDVPFALAGFFLLTVLFFSLAPVSRARVAALSWPEAAVLGLAAYAGVSLRHNGLMFLAWPFVYLLVRRVPWRGRAAVLAIFLLLFAGHLVLLRTVFDPARGLQPFRSMWFSGELISGYASHPDGLRPTGAELAALRRFERHLDYPLDAGYSLSRPSGFQEAYRKAGSERDADAAILHGYLWRAIRHNPSLLLTNRFYTAASYFVPSPRVRVFDKNQQRIAWKDGRSLAARPHLDRTLDIAAYTPLWEGFAVVQRRLIAWAAATARDGRSAWGYLNERLFALLLVGVGLALWRITPVTGLLAALLAIGVATAVLPASITEHRYLVFLLPAIVMMPLGLYLEWRHRQG